MPEESPSLGRSQPLLPLTIQMIVTLELVKVSLVTATTVLTAPTHDEASMCWPCLDSSE